ncbi:hypothetical protein J2Z21_007069 [Streptomyces griseochromogenes]|uniref:Uncharacterized protein n=1 Tax=Streptomyces griseochromogenes TaxID=68214 RepID=A0A1B1AQH5_9ACTN|nr:hypothetical protein AVL59_03565 [Streptomyces griseochromogenes]MBP2054067.1 hypothetical protein [Streptomyces griseochromogenes]
MLDLDLADGEPAGVVSWYSAIHTPVDRLPALFAELLTDTGFALGSRTVREPDRHLGESVGQAYLFARKPAPTQEP